MGKGSNNNKNMIAIYTLDNLIGQNENFVSLKEKAKKVAKTSLPILIYGETGTGKELFVQAIHNSSNRFNKAFVAQNCASIPSELLESMLFGTVKGAFTGAENRKGLFEIAEGGTLYLDELNSMNIGLQPKLLRAIQEGNIRRIGANEEKEVDVRIIASLNEEPEKLIREGKLRKDLYYRLNTVRMDIPSLEKRKDDIPLLINYFIKIFNEKFQASIGGIDRKAMNILINMEWPGNIRELQNFIEAIFNMKKDGLITAKDVQQQCEGHINEILPLREKMNEIEKQHIIKALITANNNVSKAAKLLDIPRQTLQYKIKKFNIELVEENKQGS